MPPADIPPAIHLTLRERLRIAGRVHLLLAGLLVAVPLHGLWHALGRRSPFPRLYLGWVARIVGARVAVHGTPLQDRVVFLANHLSWIDIPALAGATGTAFVAKAEVAATPVLGWLCRLNRTVFVQRDARLDIAAQINALGAAMAEAHAVAIFPEGTTSAGETLLPFKTAMLKVLEPPPPGLLVQPVLIDYGALSAAIGWVGAESGLANAVKILARKGHFPLRLHFLDPFAPQDHAGRKAIAAEARARLEAALAAARAGARPAATPAEPMPRTGTEAHDRADGRD